MGEVLQLMVKDLTEEGEGIAYSPSGLKVFIRGAYPNEVVKAELYDVKEKYAQGRLQQVVEQTVPRCTPFCTNQCGSCSYTNIGYESEISFKEKKLLDLYENLPGNLFEKKMYQGFVGMDNPFRYRNKAIYAVEKINDEYQVGLYRRNSHDIISVNECAVEPEWINIARNSLRNTLNSESFRRETGEENDRTLRYVFFRGTDDGEKLAVLVVYRKFREVEILMNTLNSIGIRNVLVSVNDSSGNRILGDSMEVLSGSDCISAELLNLKFVVNPYSFLQLNTDQTEKLYTLAVDLLEPETDDEILDLYCGIGTISLYLAGKCRMVYGVECVKEAIDNANSNAKANGISNVDFRVGLVEKVLPEIISEGHRLTKAVLDPARKGCAPGVFKALSSAGIDRIAYISCNPKTQCRDMAEASACGYKIDKLIAVDMFPHTLHVETVVLLSREKQNG